MATTVSDGVLSGTVGDGESSAIIVCKRFDYGVSIGAATSWTIKQKMADGNWYTILSGSADSAGSYLEAATPRSFRLDAVGDIVTMCIEASN